MNRLGIRSSIGAIVTGKQRPIDFDYLRRSNEVIGQNCLTNSKNPKMLIEGVYPTHATNAKGCHIFTKGGRKYIDFICGLGTNLLGYANREIIDVAHNEMCKGMCYSISSRTEVEAAEKFRDAFSFEKWKFFKSGTEACMGAIKIARAYTNRDYILTEGYHGWSNEFINEKLTPPGHGVPYQSYVDKLEHLDQINKEIAAVIIEPVQLENSPKRIKWLSDLRAKCDQTGTVLIYDEVITGGRYKKLSVSNHIDIRPDLIVLGKAISNGFPLAAVGGSKDLLDGDYFISGTYYGENVSLAVAKKVLELILESNSYDNELLWGHGQSFLDDFNALWPGQLYLAGYPTRAQFFSLDPNVKYVFWQECAKANILFGPSWFFNFAHLEVDKKVIEHIKDIILKMKIKLPKLEGPPPCQPFSSQSRQQ